MPHFHIDYSGNIETHVDISGLCEVVRSAAASLDTFPTAGVRVRALRVDHYAIADGNPEHGFVDISVRLRAGRPMNVKEDAVKVLFEAAQAYLSEFMENHSLAISLEMRDIDPALSPKTGNIRDYLKAQT
ncbi:MAG: 5-carboxymethyl-2-hydroxymuconate Delta-isomerase [Pelagimonas sp.]|uniref:5-carboxymethyl-2-hydroxymuconate Delta-isomerase n=1 Tax=Pelagimonas sp. TaxID=2073170 RepID=UPI003D6BB3F1